MKTSTVSTLTIWFLLTLTSCVSTNAVKLSAGKIYAPTDPDLVKVYLTEEDVPGEFVKIALITAKGSSGWTSEERMIEKMKKKAAGFGANAIVLNEIREPSAGAKIAGAVFGTGTQRQGKVLAIRLIDKKEQE